MAESHPSDISAQRSFLGEDDIRFKKERKRKSAPKPELPAMPDGPCCGRCAFWERPTGDDAFGQCREIVAEFEGPSDRRRVLTRDEAAKQFMLGVEPLRTRDFAPACSRYAERREAA